MQYVHVSRCVETQSSCSNCLWCFRTYVQGVPECNLLSSELLWMRAKRGNLAAGLLKCKILGLADERLYLVMC